MNIPSLDNQGILIYSGYVITFFFLACLITWFITLIKFHQDGSHRSGAASVEVASAVITIILTNIIAVILYFLTPKFAAFYREFSGGEAQLPNLTAKMVEFYNEFELHWYFFLGAYLLINIWAISNFITPSMEVTPRGVRKMRTSGEAKILVLMMNPILLVVSFILIYGLYHPVFVLIFGSHVL